MIQRSQNKRSNGSNYNENYIVDDIRELISITSNLTPTYPPKVYTAVLMQSGSDSVQSMYGLPLVIGTTYVINNNIGGIADFTNVGAPNNNSGTYFVATGTTPNNWGAVGDVDLGYNEGAPVANVLENSIGDIYWTWDSLGFYTGHSAGLFTENKSFALISSSTMGPIVTNISVYDSSNALIVASAEDGYRENFVAYIEIRVYN